MPGSERIWRIYLRLKGVGPIDTDMLFSGLTSPLPSQAPQIHPQLGQSCSCPRPSHAAHPTGAGTGGGRKYSGLKNDALSKSCNGPAMLNFLSTSEMSDRSVTRTRICPLVAQVNPCRENGFIR